MVSPASAVSSGAGVADEVSKLKSSASGEASAERLKSEIVGGELLDQHLLVRGPRLDGADPFADGVAEIEPPKPGRSVALALELGKRRLGRFFALHQPQRCDGVARRTDIRLGLRFGRVGDHGIRRKRRDRRLGLGCGRRFVDYRIGGFGERNGLHAPRCQVAGAIGQPLIVVRARHQQVALEPAIDRGEINSLPRQRRRCARRIAGQRAGGIGIVGADAGKLIDRRLGNQAADRLRKAERRGVDRAERRSHHVGARALRHLGLPGHQRDQILIADRPRHQTDHQNAQAEGSVVANSLRPFTR